MYMLTLAAAADFAERRSFRTHSRHPGDESESGETMLSRVEPDEASNNDGPDYGDAERFSASR